MKTNKNSVRRNLIISATALVLSIAMLIGTTFAWFTDSVTSGRNHIQAGNLDVELKYKNKTTTEFADVTTKTQLFDDSALWEPGHVEYVVLNVHNAGTLALKYNLNVTVDKETEGTSVETNAPFKLSSFLKYAAVAGDISDQGRADMVKVATAANPVALSGGYAVKNKSLLADSKDDTVTLVVWMPEETGNAANYKGNDIPTIELGLTLVATQYTEESDSFDNTYDTDAKYPAVGSVTAPVENGIVKSNIEIETTEKLESEPTSPVARAHIPAGAKTTAAGSDTSIQLVLRVEEAPTATIEGVDTTTNKLRTLEVTMDGLSPDNEKLITVELYMGKNLENFELYHKQQPMNVKESPDEVTADQDYYYNESTGYVTFLTNTFYPFTAAYSKDVWTNHAAERFSTPIENNTLTINSAEELALFAKNIETGTNYSGYTIVLNNNIDLDAYIWRSFSAENNLSNATINGNNHVISNMVVRDCISGNIADYDNGYGCGFIANATSPITIENITFDNANVSIYDPNDPIANNGYFGNVVGVVMGYTYGKTTFDNVSVTNSSIWGDGKVGCLLGMGADPGIAVTFKNCVSKGNTVYGNYNMGGLAGAIQRLEGQDNTSILNCSVADIDVKYPTYKEYIELNNVTATFMSDDSTEGTPYQRQINGTYWVYNDESYFAAYANYYASLGYVPYPADNEEDTYYEAELEGDYGHTLANSEYCINQ